MSKQKFLLFFSIGIILTYLPVAHAFDVKIQVNTKDIDITYYTDSIDILTGLPVNLKLKNEENNFSFIFEEGRRESLLFKCKLEGFEEEWSAELDPKQISYANVPPGKYEFQIKTKEGEYEWDFEPTIIEVNILPPYWKTDEFKMLLLGIGLLIVIYVVYRIFKKPRKEEEEGQSIRI